MNFFQNLRYLKIFSMVCKIGPLGLGQLPGPCKHRIQSRWKKHPSENKKKREREREREREKERERERNIEWGREKRGKTKVEDCNNLEKVDKEDDEGQRCEDKQS